MIRKRPWYRTESRLVMRHRPYARAQNVHIVVALAFDGCGPQHNCKAVHRRSVLSRPRHNMRVQVTGPWIVPGVIGERAALGGDRGITQVRIGDGDAVVGAVRTEPIHGVGACPDPGAGCHKKVKPPSTRGVTTACGARTNASGVG